MEHEEYLLAIVSGLVEFPEEIRIDRTVDAMGVFLQLQLHRDDMGKVIGHDGTTARALRTILRAYGAKNGARISLKINEPAGA